MKIRFLQTVQRARKLRVAGSVDDVDDGLAQEFIESGAAEDAALSHEPPMVESDVVRLGASDEKVEGGTRVRLTTTLQVRRRQFLAGTVVELSDEGAAREMVENGYAVFVSASTPLGDPAESKKEPARSDDENIFEHLNATDAVSYLQDISDVDLIAKLSAIEASRPAGQRSTVVKAIEKRLAAIAAQKSEPATGDQPEGASA